MVSEAAWRTSWQFGAQQEQRPYLCDSRARRAQGRRPSLEKSLGEGGMTVPVTSSAVALNGF
jgi:hypothetical protein